jgi:hypothetical protein
VSESDNLAEQIRDALVFARKAGEPDTHPLAHVEADGRIPDEYLRNLTATASGRTYALLSVGQAEKWLKSLGIRLVKGSGGELAPLNRYVVEVEVWNSHRVTVYATCEGDAIEEALVDAASLPWEFGGRVASTEPNKAPPDRRKAS